MPVASPSAGQKAVVMRRYVPDRRATSVWQGNWFSVAMGPVSKATQ